MANVDGSRPHGAKQDAVIAAEILGRPGRLAEVYAAILAEARRAGVDAQSLPDFLQLESSGYDIELLGQDEIEPDLAWAVQTQLKRWAVVDDSPVTARMAEVNLRIGQHRFASQVLTNFGRCCGFCGLSGDAGRGMLRASHIKPWARSSGHERLDVRNGVAACPTHDAAFDSGLLTVNGGLRIHVARALAELAGTDEPIRHAFGRPPLHATLLLPVGAAAPAKKYLDWHRDHVWAA
jgi:putative restriction endonuclease